MRAYLHLFKLNLITHLQYRAEALAGLATQIFFGLVYIMVYHAFYTSNSNTQTPMNWQELVNYIWLMQAFFSMIYPYLYDKELLKMIKDGNLAYEIIKPQNIYLKFFVKSYSKRLANAMMRSVPIIILGLLLPYPYHLSIPASFENLFIFMLALIIGSALLSALSTVIQMFTIYFLEEKGLITIYSVIADLFMGTIIPIPFLPVILKNIADYLPFKYISDFPFRIYSNNISISMGYSLILGSIIWLIISLIIGNIFTKRILRKAVVQGG